MYAKALFKPRVTDAKTLNESVESEKARFTREVPGVRIEIGEALSTGDGKRLVTLTFTPKSHGSWERVAYLEEGEFFLVFTSSSQSLFGFDASRRAFASFVSEYKEAPQ